MQLSHRSCRGTGQASLSQPLCHKIKALQPCTMLLLKGVLLAYRARQPACWATRSACQTLPCQTLRTLGAAAAALLKTQAGQRRLKASRRTLRLWVSHSGPSQPPRTAPPWIAARRRCNARQARPRSRSPGCAQAQVSCQRSPACPLQDVPSEAKRAGYPYGLGFRVTLHILGPEMLRKHPRCNPRSLNQCCPC